MDSLCYNTFCSIEFLYILGVNQMSLAMLKMYISFAGMIFLILAIGLILLSRYKLKGMLAGIISVIAYLFLIVGALIIFYIVFSGPTN